MDKEKISIKTDINKIETIDIKKEDGIGKRRKKIDKVLENFYQDKKDRIERPVLAGRGLFVKVIVLSIIFGLLAGFFSCLFLLTREKLKIPFFRDVDLREHFPVRQINLVTEKNVTIIPDERISTIVGDLRANVVDIFLAKSARSTKTFLGPVYLRNNALGMGFVLTTDGWVVTLKKVVGGSKNDYIILTSTNKIYRVEKIISDPATGVTFMKTKANDLKPAKLSAATQTIGQTILVFDKLNNLKLAHLSNVKLTPHKNREDLVYSTEKFSRYYKIDTTPGSDFISGPVFSLDKSLIGIVNTNSTIIPLNHFKELVDQVLATEKIRRPYLGIDYLDLSEISGMIDSRYQNFDYGALVYGPPASNSPAAKAGIKNADVIIKIDGMPIDSEHDLTEIIQNYRPGDEIEISLLRADEERVIKLILAEQ